MHWSDVCFFVSIWRRCTLKTDFGEIFWVAGVQIFLIVSSWNHVRKCFLEQKCVNFREAGGRWPPITSVVHVTDSAWASHDIGFVVVAQQTSQRTAPAVIAN